MFLNFSRHIIRLTCVIMLLLIQFDVCVLLMDAISSQVATVENTMGEEETSEEVYYRIVKRQHSGAKCLISDVLSLDKSIVAPDISIQGNNPVPGIPGKTVQHHIVNCVYRI